MTKAALIAAPVAWLPVVLFTTLIAACQSKGPWLKLPDVDVGLRQQPIAHLGGVGLSGTAIGRNRLWAVAERERVVVELRLRKQRRSRQLPLEGLPEGLEAESLAYLDSGLLAIGTEGRDPARASDTIFLARIEDDRVTVENTIELDYQTLWNRSAPSNKGIEGLCAAGGHLVAAAEWVITEKEVRYAPIARLDPRDGWQPAFVELSSATGKLAALDCTWLPSRRQLSVIAVERHYGVTHVLHFALSVPETRSVVRPLLLTNVGARLKNIPNIEGITRHGARLVLMTDHDSLTTPGTTETIELGPFETDDELGD